LNFGPPGPSVFQVFGPPGFSRPFNMQKFYMERLAFKMKLHPGCEAEYKRRHDALWPELAALLKATGIEEYSIFLDAETGTLFGSLRIADAKALDHLPAQPVMQKWWDYMKDIMDAHPDHSPVSASLQEVFYLP
jgi:L-rhamnose mutarotase